MEISRLRTNIISDAPEMRIAIKCPSSGVIQWMTTNRNFVSVDAIGSDKKRVADIPGCIKQNKRIIRFRTVRMSFLFTAHLKVMVFIPPRHFDLNCV